MSIELMTAVRHKSFDFKSSAYRTRFLIHDSYPPLRTGFGLAAPGARR